MSNLMAPVPMEMLRGSVGNVTVKGMYEQWSQLCFLSTCLTVMTFALLWL